MFEINHRRGGGVGLLISEITGSILDYPMSCLFLFLLTYLSNIIGIYYTNTGSNKIVKIYWPHKTKRYDKKRERERNVLFNDALNTFYLRLYGVRHMVKDHSDSEKGNPLSPHRLLLSINSKGSFICAIPQTG